MVKSTAIRIRVLQLILEGEISHREAATLLETSVRSIFNYKKRYSVFGPAGLIDHRRGRPRVLSRETERQIIAYRTENPPRSVQWIKNRLKLDVSEETIRQVILRRQPVGAMPDERRSIGALSGKGPATEKLQ